MLRGFQPAGQRRTGKDSGGEAYRSGGVDPAAGQPAARERGAGQPAQGIGTAKLIGQPRERGKLELRCHSVVKMMIELRPRHGLPAFLFGSIGKARAPWSFHLRNWVKL
jgi:hypothetical protein